ncbi:MAG: 16S rRNA (adenine(1518)-N(6)/adenine(1519)-N(6))-dimethyltransferase RsmA [Candidatus Andersenbacteria bacterium]
MLRTSLTDIAYLKRVLHQADFTPARSAGQNFLICAEVTEAVLAATAAGPSRLTELGAGIGPLTQALSEAGKWVRAIERDPRLSTILKDHLPKKRYPHLQVIVEDLRTTTWTWAKPYQLVGNIPYNLSGFILRRITQLEPAPSQVVLLLQQEVGERLLATPPHMQLLSVAVQLWGTVQLLLNVPKSCFWPAPLVNSQLLLLMPHATPLVPSAEREAVVGLAKQFFQQRRKQIGGTLAHITGQTKMATGAALKRLGIAPTQRPQELSLAQWEKLYRYLK